MVSVIRSPGIHSVPHKLKRKPDADVSILPAGQDKHEPVDVTKKDIIEEKINYAEELRKERTRISEIESERSILAEKFRAAEDEIILLNSETDKARLQAIDKGQKQGYEEGLERARKESEEKLKSIADLLGEIAGRQAEYIRSTEEMIVEIVYASVLKIVGDKCVSRDGIEAIVNHNAQQIMHRGGVIVHLSPRDYETMVKYLKTGVKNSDDTFYDLIPDERIELGGCIIETETGNIDARLEHQLVTLKNILLEARRKNEAGLE